MFLSQVINPGDQPYTEFDGTTLNANVPWPCIVNELWDAGHSYVKIAQYVECSYNLIKRIAEGERYGFSFRIGARLLTYHARYFPDQYN